MANTEDLAFLQDKLAKQDCAQQMAVASGMIFKNHPWHRRQLQIESPGPALNMITILLLAAGPSDHESLRLAQESRYIDQALRLGDFRDRFDLRPHFGTRAKDLQETILRWKPTIVHFSGHGETRGIVLEDDDGRSNLVPEDALATLFAAFREEIQLVVLNSCYSEPQAKAIAESISYVIGMSNKITNTSACAFSVSFYRALAYGVNLQTAFDLARGEIKFDSPIEAETPRLFAKQDSSTVYYANAHRRTVESNTKFSEVDIVLPWNSPVPPRLLDAWIETSSAMLRIPRESFHVRSLVPANSMRALIELPQFAALELFKLVKQAEAAQSQKFSLDDLNLDSDIYARESAKPRHPLNYTLDITVPLLGIQALEPVSDDLKKLVSQRLPKANPTHLVLPPLPQPSYPPLLRFQIWLGKLLGFIYVPFEYAQVIWEWGKYKQAKKGPGFMRFNGLTQTMGPLVYVGGNFRDFFFEEVYSRDALPIAFELRTSIRYDPDLAPDLAPKLTQLPRERYADIAEKFLRRGLMMLVSKYDANALTQHETLAEIEQDLQQAVARDMLFLGIQPGAKITINKVTPPADLTHANAAIAKRRAAILASAEFTDREFQRQIAAEFLVNVSETGLGKSHLDLSPALGALEKDKMSLPTRTVHIVEQPRAPLPDEPDPTPTKANSEPDTKDSSTEATRPMRQRSRLDDELYNES